MQIKSLGVVILLFAILIVTAWINPSFLSENNVESIIRWTSLFGFISLGIALVIMTGGIDLSIGSVIALSGVVMLLLLDQKYIDMESAAKVISVSKVEWKGQELPKVLIDSRDLQVRTDDQFRFTDRRGQKTQGSVVTVERSADGISVVFREPSLQVAAETELQWFRFSHRPIWLVLPLVLLASALIGAFHGWLITKVKLQPFVVTMCGLLAYRGIARVLSGEQSQGLGSTLVETKDWFKGTAFSFPVPGLPFVSDGRWHSVVWDKKADAPLLDAAGNSQPVAWYSMVEMPTTGILLLVVGIAIWFLVNRTVFGRYLLALGNNPQAARFSGISTDRIVMATYIMCSMLAGLTGILLSFDFNTIEPSQTGMVYEMYAVAAAVIGGCSLRGGSGSIVGVIIGTAVMRSLFLAIGALDIAKSWEFIVIGIALMAAVLTDELIRIASDARRLRAQAKLAAAASK